MSGKRTISRAQLTELSDKLLLPRLIGQNIGWAIHPRKCFVLMAQRWIISCQVRRNCQRPMPNVVARVKSMREWFRCGKRRSMRQRNTLESRNLRLARIGFSFRFGMGLLVLGALCLRPGAMTKPEVKRIFVDQNTPMCRILSKTLVGA